MAIASRRAPTSIAVWHRSGVRPRLSGGAAIRFSPPRSRPISPRAFRARASPCWSTQGISWPKSDPMRFCARWPTCLAAGH